jgi:hypothetical protein
MSRFNFVMSLEPLQELDKCIVQIDLGRVQIPDGLELSLGDDHCIRLGNTPLMWPDKGNARAEYDKVKYALETGKYQLIITPEYLPKFEFLV